VAQRALAVIGRLRGVLLEKRPPNLLLDVRGVGYEVQAPLSTFYALPGEGAEVTLLTHLVVRDDAHVLYGFVSAAERSLFRHLIRVNGVGAKLALTILSGVSADAFVRCVRQNDAATLTRLPGIGRKTAERLVMEMRDRLNGEAWAFPSISGSAAAADTAMRDAVSALVALGYKAQEASRMAEAVEGADLTSEQIIRLALQRTTR
jgi:Holliday junction DNA helicase RuvA